GGGAGVQLGQDLGNVHTALAEGFAVQVDARNRHHLAGFDLVLEQRAVDGDVTHVRVQHGHQVQRLHDVRAVLAGQGEVGLEVEFSFQTLDLFDDVLAFLGRMAANLQQGQHQGSEFVAHRQTGEGQADVAVDTVEG